MLEDNNTDDEDEEWTEMCHFLSQTQKATNNTTITSPKPTLDSVKKRKSSVDLNEDVNKKSKIAEDYYESSGLFSPNGTVYRYECIFLIVVERVTRIRGFGYPGFGYPRYSGEMG